MNQVHPRVESAPAVLALVERLVRREVLSTEEVADLRGLRQLEAGDPNTNPNTDLLQTITLSGSAQARTIVIAACEEERVFDYLVADGFPFLPRLLRQLSLKRLLALGALPTIALDGGKGPAIVVSSQPLAPADKKWLSAALGHPVASLYAPEAVVEPALREAYAQLNKRGRRDVRLGEVLVREHVIDEATRDQTLQRAAEEKLHFGEALVADGLLTEAELYNYLAAHKGLEFTTAQEVISIFDRRVAASVRFEFVRHTRIVPFQKKDGAIRVVGSDPRADLGPLRQALGGRPVTLCLALPSDIDRILEHLSGPAPSKPDSKTNDDGARPSEEQILLDLEDVTPWSRDHEDVGQEKRARYVALADQLLASAITHRASDIHLEIYDNNEVLVRFRIDGHLRAVTDFRMDQYSLRGVLNVYKVRSGLDISERRVPQGGRMRKKTSEGDVYDFRVQTQPSLHGEHVVIRLLSQSAPIQPLAELGFSPQHVSLLNRLMRNPSGLVLVSGPTGSGKTTTLYSLLDRLRQSNLLKLITIEDPIEYSLRGVQQCQANSAIGYGFAQAVRAFLREDPDVILVGETRDPETATETIRASQTGHLVLSTLHANDSIDAIRRLIDLDLNPSSIASELVAVLSQRLARRVCGACRTTYQPDPEQLRELFPNGLPASHRGQLTRGSGCALCEGRGYRGRVGLVEVTEISADMQDAIRRGVSPGELRRFARQLGTRSLIDDARDKCLAGLTTVEQALAVLPYSLIREEAGSGPEEQTARTSAGPVSALRLADPSAVHFAPPSPPAQDPSHAPTPLRGPVTCNSPEHTGDRRELDGCAPKLALRLATGPAAGPPARSSRRPANSKAAVALRKSPATPTERAPARTGTGRQETPTKKSTFSWRAHWNDVWDLIGGDRK